MSTQLPTVSLSGLIVGSTGTISLQATAPSAHPSFTQKPATLQIYNESGVGLSIAFQDTGGGIFLPAGGWQNVLIPAAETTLIYSVVYVLTNAPVNLLLMTYYGPNENVPPTIALGNSPVNVGNTVLIANLLQNYLPPSLSKMVDGTFQNVANLYQATIFEDGAATFGENSPQVLQVAWDHAGNMTAWSLALTTTLSAGTPVKLVAGNQESGIAGGSFFATSTSTSLAVAVNFKTTLTNTPTGLAQTVIAQSQDTGPGVGANSTSGCDLFWNGTVAGGISEYIIKYTTQGN